MKKTKESKIKLIFNDSIHIDIKFVLLNFGANKSVRKIARINPPINIPIMHPVVHDDQ
jgi:hypothetical protein